MYRVLYAVLLQYYVIQLFAAQQIPNFSLMHSYISELGDSNKSPRYKLMNISFAVNALIIALIGILYLKERPVTMVRNHHTLILSSLLIGSAIGSMMVALYPENTNSRLHVLGAGLSFVLGNLSLFSLATSSLLNPVQQSIALLGGIVGSISLPLFLFTSLPKGLLERLTSFPESLVLISLAFT